MSKILFLTLFFNINIIFQQKYNFEFMNKILF